MHIGIITNPHSRKNRGRADRRGELAALVGPHGTVRETRSTDEIKPIIREFLRNGVDYLVADGGDGTLHWMLNEGLAVLAEAEFSHHASRFPTTVPTNGGTIDFMAKKAGLQGDATSILERLTQRLSRGTRPEEIDVETLRLRMTVRRADGSLQELDRVGFAVAAGGVGQRFFSYYYDDADPRASTIVKIIGSALLSMPFHLSPLGRLPGVPSRWSTYAAGLLEPTVARVTVDGRELPWTTHTGIHVGAIDINLGGVVRFFPLASEPGHLHCMVTNASPTEVVRNVPNIALGRLMKARELYDGTGREMTVEALGNELLAPVIDGELYFDVVSMSFSMGPLVRVPTFGGRGAVFGPVLRLATRRN